MGLRIEYQSGAAPKGRRLDKILAAVRSRGEETRKTYRASLFPKTDAEARLVANQILLVRESSANFAYLLPTVGGLIALYNLQLIAWPRLLVWWLAVACACFGAELLGRDSVRHPPAPTPENARRAARAFMLITAVITALWASMLAVMWIPGDFLHNIVIMLIVASSLSSSSSVNAPHFASARISLWIYGTALLLGPWIMGEPLSSVAFVLVAIFVLSMSAMSRANYERTRRMLSLEEERGALIDGLQTAKDEADRARTRAETASRAKSQFLANMSHELRTPMNAILGFSELIETGGTAIKPEKQVEYAGLIRRSGQHLLMLINDVLDLSKIEAGGLQLQERDVDVHRLASDCLHLMEPRANAGSVTLTTKIEPDFPNIRADVRAFKQILLNLVSNAVKFTPAGGTVTMFARYSPDGGLMLGVEDNGVGIAEEDQARIFENFGQGRHDVVRAEEKGTGLGLPIVKGLVEAHGGRIALESRVGKGTRVILHLPAERVCAGALRAAS